MNGVYIDQKTANEFGYINGVHRRFSVVWVERWHRMILPVSQCNLANFNIIFEWMVYNSYYRLYEWCINLLIKLQLMSLAVEMVFTVRFTVKWSLENDTE